MFIEDGYSPPPPPVFAATPRFIFLECGLKWLDHILFMFAFHVSKPGKFSLSVILPI